MMCCRRARQNGDLTFLLPKEVKNILDMPWDLMSAIRHANTILDWHENLPEDETPPKWMWRFDDELDGWFEKVKEEREAKFSGGSGATDDDMGVEDGEVAVKNEYAERFGR